MRSKIKAMSYGLAYGLSAFGLSRQLSITPGEARGLMDEYFARFGGVRDYLRDVVDEARADRLHRDHARPSALPARPDQRQPAAPRDGRADGAERPDPGLGGRHHQGRDARRGPGAARRGAAVAGAAAGARRARARGGARRVRRRPRRWYDARWAPPTPCPSRWTCPSAWGAPGRTPGTRPSRAWDRAEPERSGDPTCCPNRCPPADQARTRSRDSSPQRVGDESTYGQTCAQDAAS